MKKERGKVLERFNGWKEAPHCWPHYFKCSIKRYCPPEYGDIYEARFFGFAWIVEVY